MDQMGPIYGRGAARKIIGYGPDGRPIYGTVGPGGQVIGPNGKVVGRVGPNGKVVGPNGKVVGSKGRPSKIIIHVYNGPGSKGPKSPKGNMNGGRPPGGMMQRQPPMPMMSPRRQFRQPPRMISPRQQQFRPPPPRMRGRPPAPIRRANVNRQGAMNRFENHGHPLPRNNMLMNRIVNPANMNSNVDNNPQIIAQPSPIHNQQTLQQNNRPIMKQPVTQNVGDVAEFGPY
eukprot:308759_1